MKNKKKILVIGASGALGMKICQALIEMFDNKLDLIISDYKINRGNQIVRNLKNTNFCYLNVFEKCSIKKNITSDLDCTIVAVKQVDPMIQEICAERNVPCIDITTFSKFSSKVENSLPKDCPISVIMAGFFPGLSGLTVKEGISDFSKVDEVSVNLLQNTKANVGFTGMKDMFYIISQPLEENKRGFKNKHKEILNDTPYILREINHDEISILKRKLGLSKLIYRTCWNNSLFNKGVSLIIQLSLTNTFFKLMNSLNINMDKGRINEKAYLKVNISGTCNNKKMKKSIELEVFSDYGVTAWFTSLIAKKIIYSSFKGVKYPFELLDFNDIKKLENYNKIKIRYN